MKKKRPVLIMVIAILQVVPILLLPPGALSSLVRVFSTLQPIRRLLFLSPLGIFVLLAWALLTLRPQGRILTIFIQGFNIVVRVLITLARVVPSKVKGTAADVPLLLSSLISIVLSVLILLYVDQPETQLLFEA